MSFFGNHPPINALLNFDIELQYFYSELLSVLLKSEKLKKTALESLGQDRIRHVQKTSSKASLQNTAYIFRYGPCYTSAMANYMVPMIRDNPFIFQDALWRRRINICCFGSASVFEIVAVCKIFSLAQDLFWESTRKPLEIKMTFVDKSRKWKKAINCTLKLLAEMGNILDSTKMVISVQYVKANPANLIDESMVKVLKEADIVTMVKFVSTVRVGTVMEQFIWEVAGSMKLDSIIFFQDTGMNQQCKLLQKVFEPLNDFKTIFGPKSIEPFTLSIKSVQKYVELFWSRFLGNIGLTSCIVNSCAWKKSISVSVQGETGHIETVLKLSRKAMREKVRKAKEEWCENVQKSQKALEDYHRQIHHIIPKNLNKEFIDEDDHCFFLDYPRHKDNILFKNKSKSRRIYLDGKVDYPVV